MVVRPLLIARAVLMNSMGQNILRRSSPTDGLLPKPTRFLGNPQNPHGRAISLDPTR